jgi:DNA-binding transcriptional LysR family regulator
MAEHLPDFEGWAVFTAIADAGSLSRAARDLGLAKGTVSKALSRLEARLGAPLFTRHSRSLALTTLGADALPRARALVEAGRALEAAGREAGRRPSGTVRLAAPLAFGEAYLAPILPDFLAAHPDIRLVIHLDDAPTDLVAGGFDLGLRIGSLADSSLRARRLCAVARHLVAAPLYLALHPPPAHPRDLTRHRALLYANLPTASVWRFTHPDKGEVAVQVAGPLLVNSGAALLPAARAGLGIALEPAFLLGDALATGALVPLLPDWAPPPVSLFLLAPPGRERTLAARLLNDFLVQRLAG